MGVAGFTANASRWLQLELSYELGSPKEITMNWDEMELIITFIEIHKAEWLVHVDKFGYTPEIGEATIHNIRTEYEKQQSDYLKKFSR